MINLLDPVAADLFFTIAASMGLLLAGAATIAALPWTEADISATEDAFAALLPVGEQAPHRARIAR